MVTKQYLVGNQLSFVCYDGKQRFMEYPSDNYMDYFRHHVRGSNAAAWCLKSLQFDAEIFTEEFCEIAMKDNDWAFGFIPYIYRTEKICKLALNKGSDNMRLIPFEYRNKDFYKIALSKYWDDFS